MLIIPKTARMLLVVALAGCATARTTPVPLPPAEATCAPEARPSSPEDDCGKQTASGYECARCENTAGGCVSLADGVYCVRGDCLDPYCGVAPAGRRR